MTTASVLSQYCRGVVSVGVKWSERPQCAGICLNLSPFHIVEIIFVVRVNRERERERSSLNAMCCYG